MPKTIYSKNACIAMTGSFFLTILILCFYHTSVFSGSIRDSGTEQSTLELVHLVFRHGPRTPADTYPNDPHINQTFFPYGWGHLTNNGKREMLAFGEWIRKRYGVFLGPYYNPQAVHAQSTGVPRTLMSLATVLASLFAPKNTPMEWNSRLNWQPVPIFSQFLDEDTLLLYRKSCPRYYEALKEVLESPEVKSEIALHQRTLNELSYFTGMNISQPEDVQSLYLTLLAQSEYGLELPAWAQDYFPERMQYLAEMSYIYNVYTPEMQKIKAGPFLKKMLEEMQKKREDRLKDRKLFIYSGHDSTIVNILSALKVWKRRMPRYSAMIIFELHKNKQNGIYYVEVYFRNDPESVAEKLVIPGCEFQCPLSQLVEITRDVVPTEQDKNRCDSIDKDFVEPPPSGP